jgi:cell division protein FtsB
MTGFKSKKTLTDRMADAEREGLRQQNEWQLGMDKMQREIDALRDENMALALEIYKLHKKLETDHG